MKKSIIAAGAASVALAAMPIVGAFATVVGEFTDTFSMTVGEICTLTRGETPHAANTVNGVTGSWSTDAFSATIVAGQTYDALASSTFDVTCNDVNGGYKVSVAATGLGNDWAFNSGSYGAADSAWYISSSAAAANKDLANDIVWKHTADTDNTFDEDSFTVSYNFKTDVSLPQGEYTGSAVYTLGVLGS